MARRFHVTHVSVGDIALDAATAHHARVLRLSAGDAVELFDDAGVVGRGALLEMASEQVVVRIDAVEQPLRTASIHIAAAIPKGPRADWMIEKLCEIGVDRFTPIICERSIVVPAGTAKIDRWQRLAEQAARQSGRAGVMKIEPVTPLDELARQVRGCFASTMATTTRLRDLPADAIACVGVGPEGGFSEAEISAFIAGGWIAVTLGQPILRVETAAIAAAVLSADAIALVKPQEN